MYKNRHTDRERTKGTETGRQAGRQTDRETGTKTDRQTHRDRKIKGDSYLFECHRFQLPGCRSMRNVLEIATGKENSRYRSTVEGCVESKSKGGHLAPQKTAARFSK